LGLALQISTTLMIRALKTHGCLKAWLRSAENQIINVVEIRSA
jgi:hypothetical protein